MGSDDTAAAETTAIIIFDVMNVAGLLFNSAILLPALLSPTVSRSSTWMALIASAIFYTSSYLMLLPIGQRSVSQPEYGVCLFQAALIYGAPVLVSFAGFSYVLQLYVSMLDRSIRKLSLFRFNVMLLAVPVIVSACMFTEALVVGFQRPDTVTIDSTRRYCHITSHLPRITAAILIGIGTAGMIVFEVLLTIHLYRHWKAFRKMANSRPSILAWHKLARIVVFTIFPFGAFVLNIAGLFSSGTTNDKWNLLLPILPLGAAMIFGSQMDIVRAWIFWKAPYNNEALWNVYAEPKPVDCSCPHCGKGLYETPDPKEAIRTLFAV